MKGSARRRVAVTGIGLVSPLGLGTAPTWDGIVEGRSGIATLTRIDTEGLPTTIGGEVEGFDPEDYIPHKDVKKSDTFIHYAIAASQFAVDDSGLEIGDANRERIGVVIGSGIGGLQIIEDMHSVMLEKGPRRVSPFFIPALIINMAAGQVSIRFGAKGPNSAPATACTTGLHAVGDAFRLIQLGEADAMIAGGTESPLTPLAIAGFSSMKALSTHNDEPERASRPWDRDRDGFVIGEGAGIVVLEELERARARGAHIYAELVGYAMSGDAYHISAPDPTGDGAARAMAQALEDARMPPDEVGYVNAHATSTPLGDLGEVYAVKRVFGEHAHRLAVSSTKSATGHLLGAAGGLEAGILALALERQVMPPTLNLEHADEEADLDFVPGAAREAEFKAALTNSFGFGGTNGAIVMRRFDG